MEDRMIVDLYWRRDESAIDLTAEKYGHYCNTIASNILHDAQDAEECVNDTYIGAWNSMPNNRPEKLGQYLGKLTRWIALNRLDERKSKKRGGDSSPALPLDELIEYVSSGARLEEVVEMREICAAINCFLSTLHPVERQVFLSRYWFMAGIGEISGKFGFSQSKVKSMLMRTRNKLRKFLEGEGLC